MKKLVIVLVMLGVALPALSWAQTNVDDQPICTVLTKTLRYGMRNLPATAGDNIGEVLRLQTGLKSLGYLAGTELRSSRPYFGVRTRRAVKDFQADEDLSVTGVVASLTRKALKEATCNNDECPESPPCPSVAVLCVVGYHAVTTQADKCSCPVQDCVPDNGWQPRVTRPNNGEMWTARTTQEVKWDVVGAISPYNKVDIYLLATPCSAPTGNNMPCLEVMSKQYVLDRNINANAGYNWIVATDINDNPIPNGYYKMKVCVSGTDKCDLSNVAFQIISPPSTQCRAVWSSCSCTYTCSDIPDNQRMDCARACENVGVSIIPSCGYVNGRCTLPLD